MIGMLSWVKVRPEYYLSMPAEIRPRLDTLVFEVRHINRSSTGSPIGVIDLVCVSELLPYPYPWINHTPERYFYLRPDQLIEI